MIEYIGLFTVFVILQLIAFYIYNVAMKRLHDNPYRNIELTAVAIVEEEEEEEEEEKIDPEEQKAYIEGQILIPEPEITMYYEL
tara:strand:+ start:606 stop:857 length:252 start_codon:yes stop_codon:yes gene_type:complete